MKVTCGIPTKGRYESLAQTIQSVIYQTYKPQEIIIIDDSDEPKDLREIPTYQNLFLLLNHHKIDWKIVFGRKLGQHHSHQMVQDEAKWNLIWRIDDDELAEPDVLYKLLKHFTSSDVGAVGGLVPQSIPIPFLPDNAANIITDLNRPNIQWFKHSKTDAVEVEHLTSSFVYRKNITKYELNLSPAAHREETLFTHEIKRKGFKLLVDPTAITWHFRGTSGGIRSHQNMNFWADDDKLFYSKLLEWGINNDAKKPIVLDSGLGDHVVLKSLLPELKEKYGKLVIAACFNDVFEDDGIELISIAQAKEQFGNLDRYNIYRQMIDDRWTGSLQSAFRKMYEL